MDFLPDNWGLIAMGIGAAITALGVIAEQTPNKWDNKVIKVVREIWAMFPMFSRDAGSMGRKRK